MNNIKIDDYYEPESKTSRYDEITISFKENLIDYIDKLQQENKQLKEVIDKAKEFINQNVYEDDNGCGEHWWGITNKDELLKILSEVSK